MSRRRSWGPARVAGPRFFFGLILLLVTGSAGARAAHALEWVPPRPVSAWVPGATIAPGGSRPLELVIRADGAAASLEWSAQSSGGFLATVTPSSGALVVGAGGMARVVLTVGVPAASVGLGSVSLSVTYANGGSLAAKSTASIIAATGGRPEIWPAAPTLSGAAGTSGNVTFHVRASGGETVVITAGKSNPDPNNVGAVFPGGSAPDSIVLPGGTTTPLDVSMNFPAGAWAGNSNGIQVNLTSNSGISTATAFAIVDAVLPDSLPLALRPVGVIPLGGGAAGRDGAAHLPARGAWLVPEGAGGIEVWRAGSSDSIGLTDGDGDGGDDRLVGTIRIPSIAAALAVVPGFVAASGDTLDLGLLAAGRSGLMVLDLRVIEDPPFGSWEDFFDVDLNGIDDRILRTIPMAGFATDVGWTYAPSGRLMAFVAAADTGSIPVFAAFDPLATVAGTGAGIVAVDVTTAVDSLSGLPPVAGTWSTPGNALDVEVRRGGAPDAATLAVADGGSGLAVADVALGAGAPASATFTPRAALALLAAWGAPYARDVAWIANAGDSGYVTVAAAAAGLAIARVPASGAPTLVAAQQTAAAACGVASAYTGILGVAQAAGGVALMQCPGRAALDLVTPTAQAPYTAPLVLARGAAWPGGGAPLEKATFANPAGGATALTFEPTAGPLPDLVVSDSSRVLILRPGAMTVTAVDVAEPRATPPWLGSVRLEAISNPMVGRGVFRARTIPCCGDQQVGGSGADFLRPDERIDIYDVRGRLVRTLRGPGGAAWVAELHVDWDGRDRAGRQVPSGRYWARLRSRWPYVGDTTPFLLLR